MIIKEHTRKQLSDPEAVAEIFREILAAEDEIDRDKEHFWVVGLDVKNGVRYIDLVSLGVLGHTVVHARETFSQAIRMGGVSHLRQSRRLDSLGAPQGGRKSKPASSASYVANNGTSNFHELHQRPRVENTDARIGSSDSFQSCTWRKLQRKKGIFPEPSNSGSPPA